MFDPRRRLFITLRTLGSPLPMPSRFWDPAHWRFRAEEARSTADQMTHEEARTIMRRIEACGGATHSGID